MQQTAPLGGMTPMYLLMSVFHVAPWLKLFAKYSHCPPRSAERLDALGNQVGDVFLGDDADDL